MQQSYILDILLFEVFSKVINSKRGNLRKKLKKCNGAMHFWILLRIYNRSSLNEQRSKINFFEVFYLSRFLSL